MSPSPEARHTDRVKQIADEYARRGYAVRIEPSPRDLPLDLGNYRPDLVASREGENLIIEVKTNVRALSVDRYREIAQEIAGHEGWRFLLVTGDDVREGTASSFPTEIPGWDVIRRRAGRARDIENGGDVEAAYLIAWSALEGLLRRRAAQAAIPVERLPIVPLANHLYSQGELSAEELEETLATLATRNRLVHGFESSTTAVDTHRLNALLRRLLDGAPRTTASAA